MKPIKISQKQLRSLIAEAIQHRPAGSPEPALQETEHSLVSYEVRELVQGFALQLSSALSAEFSEADPVMSRYGKEAWDAQVDGAVEAWVNGADALLDDVVKRLHTGEFH